MVRRKQRRRRASDDDIDPMAGTTNLVDAMLVLALGFLIFVVISWNMQSVIFSDMSQDQKQADIITRVGPTLGLMGTLIPLGPGLAALGAGDVNTLADALTIAFDTTVVGIGSGALCYFISKIRRGWYDQYLSDLDALSDAVLFFMNKQ